MSDRHDDGVRRLPPQLFAHLKCESFRSVGEEGIPNVACIVVLLRGGQRGFGSLLPTSGDSMEPRSRKLYLRQFGSSGAFGDEYVALNLGFCAVGRDSAPRVA